MPQQIDIVSLGTCLTAPPSAQEAMARAELWIGAKRHLMALAHRGRNTLHYPTPMSDLHQLIVQHSAQRIVLFASGDALFYGIGAYLTRMFLPDQLCFHPNITSVQSACAKLGKPWQQLQTVSLHGRDLTRLRASLSAGKSLGLLTDGRNTPTAIARELVATGYGESTVHLCAALDTPAEQISHHRADQLASTDEQHHPLNVLIIEVRGSGGLLPAFPGIPDEWFATEGQTQFTKRDVRLAALSRLALCAQEIGWDIGAGTGGISIEWGRWAPEATIYAIEQRPERHRQFEHNLRRFGDHGNIRLILAEASAAIGDLPDPDAIYIGGHDGQLTQLLASCWQRLKPGGRLLVACVTLESRAALQTYAWDAQAHIDISEITVSHGSAIGGQRVLRAQLPVMLTLITKGQPAIIDHG